MEEKKLLELQKAIETLTERLNQLEPSTTHPAVDIIISIIPLAGIFVGGAVLFFFLLWRYKITRELVASGNYTSTALSKLRFFLLLVGCVGTLVGLPLTILFFLIEQNLSYAILGGLIPLAVGLGLIIFYYLSRKYE